MTAEFRKPRRDKGRKRGKKGLGTAAKVGIAAGAIGLAGAGALAARRMTQKPLSSPRPIPATHRLSASAPAVRTTVVSGGGVGPTKGAGRGGGYRPFSRSKSIEFQGGDMTRNLTLAGVEEEILAGRAEFRKPRRDKGRKRGKRGGLSTAAKVGLGAAGVGAAAGGALLAHRLMNKSKGGNTPLLSSSSSKSAGGAMVPMKGAGMSGQKGAALGIGRRAMGLQDRAANAYGAAQKSVGKAGDAVKNAASRLKQRRASKSYKAR